jgi:hypothetical protein
MAWWDRSGDRSGAQPAKQRPRQSVYENRFGPIRHEDRAQWHLLAEQDMTTGRWTWHGAWKHVPADPAERVDAVLREETE